MSHKKLMAELDRLRAELDGAMHDNTEARDKLTGLVDEIQRAAVQSERAAPDKDLLGEIRRAIENFEAQHPRATAILNDIMVTLSNMGI